MKTTKEYPATHSMSTTWFVADEEGNIALFDFDENGPVPVDIPGENCSTLMTAEEDFGSKDSDKIEYFELTDEQVEELMTDAVTPDKFKSINDYNLFVQVNENYKKEFLEVFNDRIEFCLSHKHNIYYLYSLLGYEKPEEYRNLSLKTFFKTVKRIVHIWIDAFIEDDFSDEEQKWPLPFYCYKQPYDSSYDLAQRTNIPKFPFKEEQIPEHQRHKLLRVPLKFSECTGFQIAQYAICHWFASYEKEINNRTYAKFPKTGGGHCYILDYQDKEKDGPTPIVLPAEDD